MEKPKIDSKLSESRKVLNFEDFQGSNNNSKLRSAKKSEAPAPPEVSTGAIQKKKNPLKTIKPSSSFRNSDGKSFFISPFQFFFRFKIKTKNFSRSPRRAVEPGEAPKLSSGQIGSLTQRTEPQRYVRMSSRDEKNHPAPDFADSQPCGAPHQLHVVSQSTLGVASIAVATGFSSNKLAQRESLSIHAIQETLR